MTDVDVDLQPDVSEVIQEEPEAEYSTPIVDVAVCGPVRTQQLPRKAGGTKTVTLDAITPKHILTADHRRGMAYLVSHTEDFMLAYSKTSSTDDESMARIPKNILFPVGATVDVYVKAQATTTTLSVVQEGWAAGDA